MQLTILNGPNLNLLGSRQPEIYGSESFDSFFQGLEVRFPDVDFEYYQSNEEGELITLLQTCRADGIIFNPAAYAHTSVALADAIAAIEKPVVEVHLTNIFARETYRHHSITAAQCIGSISGFGLESYALAIHYFLNL